nr:MAG TPA: hypothetical protein [Caudoviricetes sp.]
MFDYFFFFHICNLLLLIVSFYSKCILFITSSSHS